MKKLAIMFSALVFSACPASEPPPPPAPVLPTGHNDVMTMLGVTDLDQMQTAFREEEVRSDNGILMEKRWFDAADMMKLKKVYNYDEEGFETENVFYDGNGLMLYTFKMKYDDSKNLIGEELYNEKDELISSFTYDVPIPPTGGGILPTSAELLPSNGLNTTGQQSTTSTSTTLDPVLK